MSVRFTEKNIHVQFIDDSSGKTIAAASTLGKAAAANGAKLKANMSSAQILGQKAAEIAKDKGIAVVVFDRSGARFHGKVKALADAARQGGLKF